MLNNLTNFLNLISTKMMKNVPEADDLIILGTRDHRYGGGYKPTGITASQFKNSIVAVKSVTGLDTDNTDPLNPIVQLATDGVTITGSGTVADPLVAAYQAPEVDGVTITGTGAPGDPLIAHSSGGAVNYGNVLFVDSVRGDNGTGAAGDFTKPYLTIATAYSNGSAYVSGNTRSLIYVRAGHYTGVGTINIADKVDVYFEPGCVIEDITFNDVVSTAKNVRIFGKAQFINTSIINILNIGSDATVYLEFDTAVLAKCLVFASLTAKITVRGRQAYTSCYINSERNLFQLRNSASLDAIITDYCKSEYNAVLVANQDNILGGTIRLQCPRIEVLQGTTAGVVTTYQGVIYVAFGVPTTIVTVIGDIYYSGSATNSNKGAISITQSNGAIIKIIGNIYSGVIPAFRTAYLSLSGSLTVEGNVTSGTYLIDTGASGSTSVNYNILLKNGSLKSVAQGIIGQGIHLYIQNALINVTAANDLFLAYASAGGYPSSFNCYNVNAYTVNNTKVFLNGGAVANFTTGHVDTHSNVAFGAGTDLFAGYSQIAALTLPNF